MSVVATLVAIVLVILILWIVLGDDGGYGV